jgi:serine/threonine protein phosphatase PrpC
MTQESTISLEFAAVTDIGCRRSNNEDSFGYDADQNLYVVCDGMGGNAAGEVASAMAVRALIESFASAGVVDPGAGEQMPVENRLAAAIYEANRVVREASFENPELDSMGTTLVCACLDGDRIVIGNVGDSRAYLVRNGECVQITQDHSFLDEEVRKGNMTPEMARASNLQSVITRAIGVAEIVEPDLFAASLQPDDMLLLASDGLTRYAHTTEIAHATRSAPDLEQICNSLIQFAKQGGGVDNITCILLRVVRIAIESRVAETEAATEEFQADS